jgi:hypothetical protein
MVARSIQIFAARRRAGRLVAATALVAGALVIAAPIAAAATNVAYAMSGVEVSATSTVGTFVGTGIATDDAGLFSAQIVHIPLSGGSATVTGGTFSFSGALRHLTGAFTGGSVSQASGFTGCTNQTYNVIGTLALSTPAGGSGTFAALLTHYRTRIFGSCITYSASVRGTATFSLP